MTGPWALAHWARGPWPIGPWALAHWAHGPWPIGPWALAHWPMGPCPLAHWPMGPGPWALAHWAHGPWPIGPMGPCPLAHGPWPMGPCPLGPIKKVKQKNGRFGSPKYRFVFQKNVWEWLPLVWKMSGYLGGVFLSYLEPPNSHIVKNQKIVKTTQNRVLSHICVYFQLLLNWPVATLIKYKIISAHSSHTSDSAYNASNHDNNN